VLDTEVPLHFDNKAYHLRPSWVMTARRDQWGGKQDGLPQVPELPIGALDRGPSPPPQQTRVFMSLP
jgi:hypothetical protein